MQKLTLAPFRHFAMTNTHTNTETQHGGRRHHFVVVAIEVEVGIGIGVAFSIVVGLLFIYALSRLNAARFAAHAQDPKT